MRFVHIRVEKRAPIAVVTLDRPQAMNALNAAMLCELDAVFAALVEDSEVRVVLVTGAGDRAFAAGADIAEFHQFSAQDAAAFAVRAHETLRRLEMLEKPVIACVRGYALGGACELALACSFRIAAEDAKFGVSAVRLGMMQTLGGTKRLPVVVGRGMALKLLLTGETIDAAEALRIGLVEEVVPVAQLMERAEELALAIAGNAPLAVTETLRSVNEQLEWRADKSTLREADRFGRLFGTEDKVEGTLAFLEKRKPVWKGK